MNEGSPLAERLIEAALAEGFLAAGVVDLEPALASSEFQQSLSQYDRWLAEGRATAMTYLVRGRDRRADPRLVFPETKSVFCVLSPYGVTPPGETDPSRGPLHARYLNGRDYHEELVPRLERALKSAGESLNDGTDLRWKICVDTSAVLERTWAALTGLGWIGKNTLLIHPRFGSFTFIGVALLNRVTGLGPRRSPDLCGHCRRCLDGCPTRAFPEPRSLDPARCIASWTLETRGPLPLSLEDQTALGSRVAGCDLCQEVCPFNQRTLRSVPQSPEPDSFSPKGVGGTWKFLLEETPEAYRARIRPTALSRIKPAEWSRNLALALRNQLNALPVEKAQELARELRDAAVQRAAGETTPFAQDEWRQTLQILNASLKESESSN